MKPLLGFVAIGLFASPLFSQNQTSSSLAACGDLQASMAVSLNSKQHTVEQPEPERALIYFIQDTGLDITLAYPTTKIGIDGKWVGANKKDSYFSIAVDPGEHHFCAEIQSSLVPNDIELAHLTTEAGKVYYYRTRIVMSKGGPIYLGFVPVDSDEASYMIESYPLATAHARK
jgi:Protein of unknown function (DUF2846)